MVTIRSGALTLNLRLAVASTTQQIVVEENAGPAVSTDAASNASATVLRGDDLAALSDDPEDLQADLEAMAGPSAGPGGGAIFIDGFSSGELPPKESIREIRINQNPFSPEFDKLGLGRIEILTKPGSDLITLRSTTILRTSFGIRGTRIRPRRLPCRSTNSRTRSADLSISARHLRSTPTRTMSITGPSSTR
jgi:hypothetical protein